MAKMSTADLLDAFKEMTLLELSDFVKQFEETFDFDANGNLTFIRSPELLDGSLRLKSRPSIRFAGQPGDALRALLLVEPVACPDVEAA